MFISPNNQIFIKATSIKRKDDHRNKNKFFKNDFIYLNFLSNQGCKISLSV